MKDAFLSEIIRVIITIIGITKLLLINVIINNKLLLLLLLLLIKLLFYPGINKYLELTNQV